MNSLAGQLLLDRYSIDAFIGRGGMADVYRAWDLRRNTFVALKVLREDLSEDRVFLRRFRREAAVLERLQHRNIVRYYGFEEQSRLAFLVVEFVEGYSLRTLLSELAQPLTVHQALALLEPVCYALGYAHSQGILHCDIKPANILIERSGRVLLGDFGLARWAESATTTFAGAGAPAYMSPEQCRGESLTPQSDIYSLSVTLFEMLTLDRPFKGDIGPPDTTVGERVRWEQIHARPPSPRAVNPQISVAVEQAILTGLSKEPQHRQASALDIYLQLTAAGITQDSTFGRNADAILAAPPGVGGLPTPRVSELAIAASRLPPPPKLRLRPRPLLAGLGVGSTLLVVVVVVIFASTRLLRPGLAPITIASSGPTASRGQPRATPGEVPVAAASREPIAILDPRATGTATAPTTTTIPEQEHVTARTPTSSPAGSSDPPPEIGGQASPASTSAATPASTPTSTLLPSPSLPAPSPTISQTPTSVPLSGRLVFTHTPPGDTQNSSELYMYDLQSGTLARLTNNDVNDWIPRWSPRGEKIVYTSGSGGRYDIWTMDPSGANSQRIVSLPAWNEYPAWAPDGLRVAFATTAETAGVPNAEIHVREADGTVRRVTTNSGRDEWPAWSPDGQQIVYGSEARGSMDIFVIDSNGQNPMLVVGTPADENRPAWSPDGQWIAFIQHASNSEESFGKLMLVSPDGTALREVASTNDALDPAWSPDSQWIVFTRGIDSDGDGMLSSNDSSDIWAIRIDDGTLLPLVVQPGGDWAPSWTQ